MQPALLPGGRLLAGIERHRTLCQEGSGSADEIASTLLPHGHTSIRGEDGTPETLRWQFRPFDWFPGTRYVLSQKWKSLDVGIIWNKQLAQKPIWPCVSTFMCFGSHRFGGEVHWACVMRCGWRCASAQSLRFQMLFLVFSRIIMDEAALHLSDKCNTVTVNLNRGAFQTNSGADYRCWTVWECIKAILVWSGVGKVGSY